MGPCAASEGKDCCDPACTFNVTDKVNFSAGEHFWPEAVLTTSCDPVSLGIAGVPPAAFPPPTSWPEAVSLMRTLPSSFCNRCVSFVAVCDCSEKGETWPEAVGAGWSIAERDPCTCFGCHRRCGSLFDAIAAAQKHKRPGPEAACDRRVYVQKMPLH